MSDNKSLMLSTLPNGYEVVEDREYEGGEQDELWWNGFGWELDDAGDKWRWTDAEWKAGCRYATKVPVPLMRWSKEVPTATGFYWCRWPDDGPNEWQDPQVEEIYEDSDGLYVDGYFLSDLPGALWWPIPIQPPKDNNS